MSNKSGVEISILYLNDISKEQDSNNVAFYISNEQVIAPDSVGHITRLGDENAWHDYIEKGHPKRVYFYIFQTDTLRKYNNIYSMNELVQKRKYFKLVSYSENELKKIKWKIVIDK